MMRAVALAGSTLCLPLSPAAAQDSASGTILAPTAASSTGHFVSGVADALPKIPNHTANTQNAQNPQNGPSLNLPAHPLVLHPVMPTLPVIPAPHTISTAVTAGPAPARQVVQVNAVPAPAAAPAVVPSTATNPPLAAPASALAETPSAGLLPTPRIDPSIGSANITATAPQNPANTPPPLAAASSAAPPNLTTVAAVMPNGAENNEAIHLSAMQFLQQQTAGLPGQVGVTVTPVAPRGLSACDALQPFLPAGAHLWGRTTVGVRCVGAHPWVVYLQALISVKATYFVASHEIATNQVIAASDLTPREGDLTNLPRSVVTDLSQIVGKSSLERISAGLLLRQDMVRAVLTIQAGESVKLVAQGAGFSISYEGSAINSAATGESIKVRTPSGQVVSGVVKDRGTVEIRL